MALPHQEQARARLGEALYRYVLGRPRDLPIEAPDANEAAFAAWRLLPRVMRGHAGLDLSSPLCGRTFAAPLAIGPFAGDRVFHAEGLLPVANICQRLGLPLMVSEETVTTLAELGAAHDACWLQLRAAGPLDRAMRLADAAARCGMQGLVLTILAPSNPSPASQPGGYDIGAEIAGRGWSTIGSEAPGIAVLPAWPQWAWRDVATLAAHLQSAGLTLLVKGVLHPEDAAEAAQSGCAGVIVSNIGLRQNGRWALPLDMLEQVAARAEGAVLLDGGVRHGVDVVIASCLGADFAIATRPVVTALAAGGAPAVEALLQGWIDEIAAVASWLGVARVSELDRSCLSRDHAA